MTEWHLVQRRVLTRHKGVTGLAVEYVCALRTFVHYVGPEGSEDSAWFFAGWWREHGGAEPPPANRAEAIERADELANVVAVKAGVGDDWVHWRAVPGSAFDYLATKAVH